MTRATVLQEVRQMRFEELYERRQRRDLTMAEAAEVLGVAERTFRRWRDRYEADGAAGLQDRRIGQASARAVPVDEVLQMVTLYQTRYTGWTVKHFHERWQQEHGGQRSYTWTKKTLQAAGQVPRAPRRGVHRKKRPRKPLPGMMLHQDGSTYEWVPGCQWDLIVTLDDATSEIYSAFFVEEEGTLSSFQGVREVIEAKGLFSSLYTDRGSHYWHTETAGGARGQDSTDAGAPGLAAIRHHADSRLLARSARALGADVPNAPRSTAERIGPHGYHRHGGRESLVAGPLSAGLQPALSGACGGIGHRVRSVDWREPRRSALCARRTGRGQGQYGALSPPPATDPAGRLPVPLCAGDGAGAGVSRWDPRGVPWPSVPGAVHS